MGIRTGPVRHADRPVEAFDSTAVPVAVELRRNVESLITFAHPDNAVYVFGPEDGSLDRAVLEVCHRFVVIPTRHCTNLSAAVYTVLYDRHAKRVAAGLATAQRIVGRYRRVRGNHVGHGGPWRHDQRWPTRADRNLEAG